MEYSSGPLCGLNGGHPATWISSLCVAVWYLSNGWQCSQHAKDPTRLPNLVSATLIKLFPDASPKIVLSICVGFNLRRLTKIVPSASIRAWAMYKEWLSFSENPRDTTILFLAAHAWIVRISSESTANEFWMYFVDRTGSTGRLLE